MTLDHIKQLLHGTRAFTLRMVSGRVIEIPHPDFVALTRSETGIVLESERGRIELIRLNQIESFETTGEAAG